MCNFCGQSILFLLRTKAKGGGNQLEYWDFIVPKGQGRELNLWHNQCPFMSASEINSWIFLFYSAPNVGRLSVE